MRYDWDAPNEPLPVERIFCSGAISGAVLQSVLVVLFLAVIGWLW